MKPLQMSQRWLDEYTLSERIEIHTVCWPKVQREESVAPVKTDVHRSDIPTAGKDRCD
jgi:hypothetical protein